MNLFATLGFAQIEISWEPMQEKIVGMNVWEYWEDRAVCSKTENFPLFHKDTCSAWIKAGFLVVDLLFPALKLQKGFLSHWVFREQKDDFSQISLYY